jgi:probable phosphoglycerate mutase
METADIINRYLAVDIIKRPELRDINKGSFLRGWEFLNEFHPDFSQKFSEHTEDVRYPGGENGEDVLLRSNTVINEILESGCSNAAVMTHMGTIRALICGMIGLRQAQRFLIGTPIEHCSISIINQDKKSGQLCLHTINDYAHLEILNNGSRTWF